MFTAIEAKAARIPANSALSPAERSLAEAIGQVVRAILEAQADAEQREVA